MRIVILHSTVDPAKPDQADTLVQAEAVKAALRSLGHKAGCLSFGLNLAALKRKLDIVDPDLVFNLVEDVEGSTRMQHLAPSVLEHLGLPFTGTGSAGMLLSNDKLLSKKVLASVGIPTPAAFTLRDGPHGFVPGRYIVKSVSEHASVGLDDASVVDAATPDVLVAAIHERRKRFGGVFFAEAYVEGREFNVSLLGRRDAPIVLPPAEILFDGLAPGRPRIVGYDAKWDEASEAYAGTPRRFDLPPADAPLLRRLAALARRTWRVFGLEGYARVDFRVDEAGVPLVIDVNANPCLSPDAGFAAALASAGIGFAAGIGAVADEARGALPAPRRGRRAPGPRAGGMIPPDPAVPGQGRGKAARPGPDGSTGREGKRP